MKLPKDRKFGLLQYFTIRDSAGGNTQENYPVYE